MLHYVVVVDGQERDYNDYIFSVCRIPIERFFQLS